MGARLDIVILPLILIYINYANPNIFFSQVKALCILLISHIIVPPCLIFSFIMLFIPHRQVSDNNIDASIIRPYQVHVRQTFIMSFITSFSCLLHCVAIVTLLHRGESQHTQLHRCSSRCSCVLLYRSLHCLLSVIGSGTGQRRKTRHSTRGGVCLIF